MQHHSRLSRRRVHRWSVSRTLGSTLIRSGWSCGDRKWLVGERPICVAYFTLHYFRLQFLTLCLTNPTIFTGVFHKMLIFTDLINTAHRSGVLLWPLYSHKYGPPRPISVTWGWVQYFEHTPLHLWGYQVAPVRRIFCKNLGTCCPSVPRMLHAKPSPYYAPSGDPDAVWRSAQTGIFLNARLSFFCLRHKHSPILPVCVSFEGSSRINDLILQFKLSLEAHSGVWTTVLCRIHCVQTVNQLKYILLLKHSTVRLQGHWTGEFWF